MTQQVVNRTFCLDYIGEYCDRTGIYLSEIAAVEASILMVRYLTKGQAVENVPREALEDAAWMAVTDAAYGATA